MTSALQRKLHSLRRAIGMDEDVYRDMLAERFGVSTSKDLTDKQAAFLVEDWEKKAIAAGVWKKQEGHTRYDEFKRRGGGMATPAQLRMVRAMWDQVARAPKAERDAALDKFVKRIIHRDALRFARDTDVAALVAALEAMGAERMV